MKPAIVWFRQDLRLADNPALNAAIERGGSVICLFIDDFEEHGDWPPGAARRWWMHHSLQHLAVRIDAKANRLILRRGQAQDVLDSLIESTGAEAVYWNRRYEPALIQRDKTIKQNLKDRDIEVQSYNAALLYEPWEVETKQGEPYQVYSPFWRMCQQMPEPDAPMPEPSEIPRTNPYPDSLELDELELLPKIDWASGMRNAWKPGEQEALSQLEHFLKQTVWNYKDGRDIPGESHTSRLSPYLCHGEISPRQIWHATTKRMAETDSKAHTKSAWKYLAEIGWREFGYHLLYHFPHTPNEPLRSRYANFPWRENQDELEAWERGRTGYPIVDAGMRQLWDTGWMHNRVRMIVASFLVKDLRMSWLEGARWFWDTLVDADLANNTLGWQWAGGCGADAAPYFRIFNPTLQSKKFDGDGIYIHRWVPELRDMPVAALHAPWEAKDTGGVELGSDYPHRIVDHAQAREAALQAFDAVKGPS